VDGLQISLVVLLVLINLAALTWASFQDRKARAKPQPKIYEIHLEGTKVFSDVDLAEIQKAAKEQLHSAAEDAAQRLQKSLNNSVDQVAADINDRLSTDLIAEFEKYQVSLGALRDQTIEQFSKIQSELDHRRLELIEHVDRQVAAEQEKRLAHFNERINDVVTSYITESLGSNVDLGAQTDYILQALEANKEQIKKDILS
jgi:predicted HicB family RNase H-like nuclease